jgi:hypothetical protein
MKALRAALLFLVRLLLVFLVAEGLASGLHVARSIVTLLRDAPRLHTRYDPDLGWVSTPRLALEDHWGRGASLHTNAQGFRGRQDIPEAAAGRRRIVCTGDSFTLGVGVADDETWCARLAEGSPGLEAVNMGQGGYGVDQAFLWYRRDGARLEQRVHVFAFVSVDLDRMLADRFVGFPKPYLDVDGGRLVTRNVPVPRGPYLAPWVTLGLPRLDELRLVALARRLASSAAAPGPRTGPMQPLAVLFPALLEELRALHTSRGSRLVVVYLPTVADLSPSPAMDAFRADLAADLARRGFDYHDLTQVFRDQPDGAQARLFLPATLLGRHYTAEGHRLVADSLRGVLGPI